MSRRDRFIQLMLVLEGTPYGHAGGHLSRPFPEQGHLDCSGLIRFGLIHPRIAIRPETWDANSRSMFKEFPEVHYPYPGVIVFWADDTQRIGHVEVVYGEGDFDIQCIAARCSKDKVVPGPLDMKGGDNPRIGAGGKQMHVIGYCDPFAQKRYRIFS